MAVRRHERLIKPKQNILTITLHPCVARELPSRGAFACILGYTSLPCIVQLSLSLLQLRFQQFFRFTVFLDALQILLGNAVQPC